MKQDWENTKTPNKRSIAVETKLAYLNELYSKCHKRWYKLCIKKTSSIYGAHNSTLYFQSNGILKKRGMQYRWIGPPPSQQMVNEWLDFIMDYQRSNRTRKPSNKIDHNHIFENMATVDNRVIKCESSIKKMYIYLRRGYRIFNFSNKCSDIGLSLHGGQLLIEWGYIENPRRGRYKWVGQVPDRELALKIYGLTSEYNRSIYRSMIKDKDETKQAIDDLTQRTTSPQPEPPIAVQPAPKKEAPPQQTKSYWSEPCTTW